MRPKALIWFDVFALIALAVYSARAYIILTFMKQAIAADPAQDPQMYTMSFLLTLAVISGKLMVWFSVSRLRKPIAAWIWIAIGVFGMTGLPEAVKTFFTGGFVVIDVLYYGLYFGGLLGSMLALLRSSTRAWLGSQKA